MESGLSNHQRTLCPMSTVLSWKPFLLTGIVMAYLLCGAMTYAGDQKRVLFISSYHPGFPTFFQQVEGLGSIFDKKDILLDIEYMDTKRFPGQEQWALFHNSLKYKFEYLDPYDAIIVADDNALRYALQEQQLLFQHIPIVFMGVNNIERALSQNDNPQITGVVEAVSIAETVELMIRLRPKASRIVAIVDNTPSGQADLKKFYKVAERFGSHEFSEISLAGKTWSDFLQSLGTLDEDSAVLLLSAYKDKNSKTYLFEEGLKKIKDELELPVFHLWHHGIGDGLIGGKVISHFEQGRTAADITQKILSGTPVSEIEVISLSPNKYVFDHSELRRNHIDKSLLPKDSVILHEPISFYEQYKKAIWTITSTITFLTVALLISVANILKRIKVERKLKKSEERLDLAMKAVSDGVWDWNIGSETVFYSQGWGAILSEENVNPTYEFWESRIHPEDKDAVLLSLQKSLDGRLKNWEIEHRLKTKTGHWKWVLGRGAVVDRNDKGEPARMLGTLTDISDRKRTEEALRLVAASGHLSSREIFSFLVRQISAFSGMRWAIIARVSPHDTADAHTVAVWNGDRLAGNFSYSLKDTPCENVLSDGVCFYPLNVKKLFPKDLLLAEMGAESYWGAPLLNSAGEVIGIMALLHDQPTAETPQTLNLLETFAIRAASELERLEIVQSLEESEIEFRALFENTPVSTWLEDFSGLKKYFDSLREEGISDIETFFRDTSEGLGKCAQCIKIIDVNKATLDLHQAKNKKRFFQGLEKTFTAESWQAFKEEMIDVWNGKTQSSYEAVVRTFNDDVRYVTVSYKVAPGHEESLDKVLVTLVDITERKQAEEALKKRMAALTRPLDQPEGVTFEDLFDLEDIQRLQDQFAMATGVASIITNTDGAPITRPSNFCRLCKDIIRKTDKGLANCFKSDAMLGKGNANGPAIQPCLSGGLWDAGARVSVGGRHIANWLIGQVRDETQTDAKMRDYAAEIGADAEAFIEAFREVPSMSREKFEKIAQALFTLADRLSDGAYRNVQQARFITDFRRLEAERAESEESYKNLLHNLNAGVVVHAPDTSIVIVNPAACSLLGLPEDRLTGRKDGEPDWKFLRDDGSDMTSDEHPVNRVLSTKSPLRNLVAGIKRSESGDVVWVLVNGFAKVDDSNLVEQVIISFVDITERKRFEEALVQSEKDLKKSQQIAHIGSWRLDLVTNQVQWTEELYHMYGFDPTLPPPPYTEHMKLFTPESWERLSSSLTRTSETGIPYELELETVRKDGSNGWMWVRGEAVSGEAGETIGLWGAAQDITERKQTELALKESEERFKALHSASFGGVVIHDKGLILECNNGLSEITGYEYDELIGMNGLYLISDDTRDRVIRNIEAGYEKPYEVTGVHKNGDLYPLRLEGRQIPYQGKSVRVVEFRNITEIKRAEKERRELEGKLRQAQKMEAVGRLAGGVAHDFNNMLNVIIGNAELAMEDVDASLPLHTALEEIRSAGMRSADLTRQLLAFARKQTISPRVIDINKTVSGMLRMLQRLIGEDIDLLWQPGENLWSVKVDPSQIDQILANLCVNARDAIEDVGKVTIETGNTSFDEDYCTDHPGFMPGDYVLLAVSDNGCGMEAETMDNIFEPFFTTKDTGQGTGLGLATVYGVVKQNSGFVYVYSEPRRGTIFKVYLPRYETGEGFFQDKEKNSPAERGHETILLVEDEPAILRMTRMMLERLGYHVVSAETPGEAIRLAQEHSGRIDLLVTDVIMPEMNGRDLARNILTIHPDLKRLFMSGYTANVIAHHGVLDSGVNFIQKPFSRESLGSKVREVLEQSVD